MPATAQPGEGSTTSLQQNPGQPHPQGTDGWLTVSSGTSNNGSLINYATATGAMANMTVVKGSSGTVRFRPSTAVQILIDVVGYIAPENPSTTNRLTYNFSNPERDYDAYVGPGTVGIGYAGPSPLEFRQTSFPRQPTGLWSTSPERHPPQLVGIGSGILHSRCRSPPAST